MTVLMGVGNDDKTESILRVRLDNGLYDTTSHIPYGIFNIMTNINKFLTERFMFTKIKLLELVPNFLVQLYFQVNSSVKCHCKSV